MDRKSLLYLVDILQQDSMSLYSACSIAGEVIGGIADEELKRVINTKLDNLKADISNVQHFIEE